MDLSRKKEVNQTRNHNDYDNLAFELKTSKKVEPYTVPKSDKSKAIAKKKKLDEL
jgi:hypothetical protein